MNKTRAIALTGFGLAILGAPGLVLDGYPAGVIEGVAWTLLLGLGFWRFYVPGNQDG